MPQDKEKAFCTVSLSVASEVITNQITYQGYFSNFWVETFEA